jgi:signal transduction histidine kinase
MSPEQRRLHDDAMQPLAALELRLSQLRQRLGPDVEPGLLDTIESCAEETARRMRALLRDLQPGEQPLGQLHVESRRGLRLET